MKTIAANLLYQMEKHLDLVLVSVIWQEHSAPRGTGSLMLVNKHGRVSGTIGGGAVERISIETAVQCIDTRESRVITYDLGIKSPEGGVDTGMSCGGNVRVLFQYISSEDIIWRDIAVSLSNMFKEKKSGCLIQKLDGSMPALTDESGTVICGDMDLSACNDLPVSKPLHADKTFTLPVSKPLLTYKVFIMPVSPGERVIIFGAGHCGRALTPILASIGFRVWVYDNRPEYADAEYFPQAEKIICGDFEKIEENVDLTEDDYIVIMTTGHAFDMVCELQALKEDHAYVGMIGSKRKIAAVHARQKAAGIPDDRIATVHTPIGLEIGAETPEEIAVSIAAEMIMVRAQR